ncbi:class I SAM-dependent methyltransferase [Reyranella sp.]|uniref:class I SAM-dependent methyltransferase n=1 Tax=Reyranella sp. TaxID=1929291 RepID=UPI003BAA3544
MDSRWPAYPAIRAEHVSGARLFANRYDQIAGLPVPKGGKVAEIGVWRAAFSKILVELLQPRQFLAFDIFTGHLEQDWNGMTGHQLFDGLTHRQFYEREMAVHGDVVTVVEGASGETLRGHTDHSFDLVYIDGNHNYDFVKADAELGAQMIKDSGYLVFNDYMLIDHNHANYGIVPVVNDMVVNGGWQVVGFALDQGLYCDIALQRRAAVAAEPAAGPAAEPAPATPVAAPQPAAVHASPSVLQRIRSAFGL